MGGIFICDRCDIHQHSHDGGIYIEESDMNVCDNCAGELEAEAELREEE